MTSKAKSWIDDEEPISAQNSISKRMPNIGKYGAPVSDRFEKLVSVHLKSSIEPVVKLKPKSLLDYNRRKQHVEPSRI